MVSDVDTYDQDSDALTLMTMHSAKGLEFEVVFVVGMEETLFPHTRALYDASEMEEERRLCYVAMTRAKQELYLLHAGRRLLYGGIQRNIPSRFLSEVDSSYGVSQSYGGEQRVVYDDQPITFKPNFGDSHSGGSQSISIAVGDRVKHQVFGRGEIIELDDDVASIRFEGRGVKKLNISFAPLEKL